MRRTTISLLVFSQLTLIAGAAAEAGWRNGTRFDPGTERTARAEGAPAELDRVADSLGQYDVELTTYPTEGEPMVSHGLSEITFINRGHALMESFYSDDVGGHPLASVMFLGFNPALGRWFLAGADSRGESAWVADGGFTETRLVLSDTVRRNGGIGRTEVRYVFDNTDDGAPLMTVEESANAGVTWTRVERRVYRRRPPEDGFLAPASRYGAPHPDRPAAAAAFDFLVGEWNESHDMTLPTGQQLQWQSNGTGVYALDGAAILEFSWFDVDPSLPDAATTILRIYNRAMRRWECLYVPNRGHGILYFGGVQEGDRIVLTNFEATAAAAPYSRYVFHQIAGDSYAWFAERSSDRGATWAKSWKIAAERKPAAAELAGRDPGLDADERRAAVAALEGARDEFEQLVAGVAAADWHRKPAPDRWSVGEVAEHVLLSEKLLFGFIEQALAAGPDPEWAAKTEGKMERIESFLPNRSIRAQAPGPLVPTGEVGREDCLRELAAARAATLELARTTEAQIKAHIYPHPADFFGDLNAHQWLHFIAAHQARHNQQIAEVKDWLAAGSSAGGSG